MSRPGWYVDPVGEGDLRLWDGTSWTAAVRSRRPTSDRRAQPVPIWWTASVAIAALGVLLVVLVVVSTAGTGSRPSLGATRTTETVPAPAASNEPPATSAAPSTPAPSETTPAPPTTAVDPN